MCGIHVMRPFQMLSKQVFQDRVVRPSAVVAGAVHAGNQVNSCWQLVPLPADGFTLFVMALGKNSEKTHTLNRLVLVECETMSPCCLEQTFICDGVGVLHGRDPICTAAELSEPLVVWGEWLYMRAILEHVETLCSKTFSRD